MASTLEPLQNQEQEQNTAFNQNAAQGKFNKFRGLGQMFQQNKAQPLQAPGTAKQNVIQGTSQAQNQKSQQAVQTGQGVKAQTGAQQGAYTIGAGPQVNVNTKYQVGATLASDYNPQYTQATEDIRNQSTSTQTAIADWEKAENERLASEAANQEAFLKAQMGNEIADTGRLNELEASSNDLNQVLAQDQTSNLSAMAQLFGSGYNAERTGALDSQIYQEQLDKMKQQAGTNLQEADTAKRRKSDALRQYSEDLEGSRKSISDFRQNVGKGIAGTKSGAEAELKKQTDSALNKAASQFKSAEEEKAKRLIMEEENRKKEEKSKEEKGFADKKTAEDFANHRAKMVNKLNSALQFGSMFGGRTKLTSEVEADKAIAQARNARLMKATSKEEIDNIMKRWEQEDRAGIKDAKTYKA